MRDFMKYIKQLIILSIVMIFIAGITDLSYSRPQPRMKKALRLLRKAKFTRVGEGKINQLKRARKVLKKAARNKGGHRVQAIKIINRALRNIRRGRIRKANKLIQKAIWEVRDGIKAGNRW